MNPTARTGSWLVLLVILASPGCEESGHVQFQVQNTVASQQGALPRNDEVVLQFSAPVDESSPSPDSVRVLAADGGRLPVSLRVEGARVVVSPGDSEGWPSNEDIEVEVPYPVLGRPIRSKDG